MSAITDAAVVNVADTSRVMPLLEALEKTGARQFDPVRFCFIESLTQRIDHHTGQSRKLLEQKALSTLRQFREDFEHAKHLAAQHVAATSTRFPGAAEQLTVLLQEADIREVYRLTRRLAFRQNNLSANRCALIDLTESLYNSEPPEYGQQATIKRQLQQQESNISKSLSGSNAARDELKSIRDFRESLGRAHADKLVGNSVSQGPKDAGPLNPERLAIHSLSALKRLSPAYLNRFTSYVETLLWLQQIDDISQASRKKAKK